MTQRPPSEVSIRIPDHGPTTCSRCHRRFFASDPAGHDGTGPICDPCLLAVSPPLAAVLRVATAARIFATATRHPRRWDDDAWEEVQGLVKFSECFDWLVPGADRSALYERWLQEDRRWAWIDPEKHRKLRKRQASRFRIVIPASGGETLCSRCDQPFDTAGPTGYLDAAPICDRCFLEEFEDLGLVLGVVRAARHLASAKDSGPERFEAVQRLGEMAWSFDASMLSVFPGPWRDRQGKSEFIGGEI